VSTYDTLEQALDGLRDPQTFAELASTLLLEDFPQLVMGARTGDTGRDARVRYGLWGREIVVIQYSIDRKWQSKIDRELRRYEKDPSLPKRMIYVTHLTATEQAQRVRIEKADAQGVTLEIFERGWLWPRLQHKHRKLAEELLGLRPALPGRFVEADERRAELQLRIPGFGSPLIPTPGLDQFRAALASEQRVLLLVGPGGSGKTRAALSSPSGRGQSLVLQAAQGFDRAAVGELDPYTAGMLVIDDAHRVEDLSGIRAMLDDAAWRNWTVVMTLRPGFTAEVLDRAGVEANQATEIGFGGLSRQQAADLLANEPYEITLPELASHLITIARGNPLMLHMGADAAVRRNLTPHNQADVLRGYARQLRRSLPDGLHVDLLALAAFYGRLSVTERLPLIRHLHPVAALPDIRAAIADIADAGLGLTDRDTLTILPDAIAPILALDMLLQTGEHARLRLADIELQLDMPERARVLPIFAAAVLYGGGQGHDGLRTFVSQTHPQAGQPASTWAPAVREVCLYARALPQEAAAVLETVLGFPTQELAGDSSLLNATAEAARALAEVSLSVGLPLLLSVVALAPGSEKGSLSSPGRTLSDLLQSSPSYGGQILTERTARALSVTRAWLADEPHSPSRQRVALRVALMLIAVTYEFVGPSVVDAMAVQIGDVPAPDTQAHRAAIREAAQFAADLVASAEPEALGELRETYPLLLRRAAGPAPTANVELASTLRSMMRSVVSAVRSAVLACWDRLPPAARLGIMEADGNRRIQSRAGSDPEITRLSLLFVITRADRPRTREWTAQLGRARKLGQELGPDEALDLLSSALGQAQGRLHVSGAPQLLMGTGETGSRIRVQDALRRMSADPQLRPYLGSLLAGALKGPGVAPTTLRALAGAPETAAQTVDVLDLITPAEERRLTKLLDSQPVAHAALARHLSMCRRPMDERAHALIELAEQTDTATLGDVLEQFSGQQESVAVPDALGGRFADLVERLAREAALDRRGAANVGDAFALVVARGDDRWLSILEARGHAMDTDRAGELGGWDLLPDDFAPALNELSDDQRDEALPRLASWLQNTDRDTLNWRTEHGIIEMLPRVGADRPMLAATLRSWYAAGGKARARTLRLLSPLLARGTAGPALDAILADTLLAEEESALIAAACSPPLSWIGDLENEYTRRAEFFAERARSGSPHARSFAQAAETHLRRLSEAEAQSTRRRKEGYDAE
jgi:hypothetical protein